MIQQIEHFHSVYFSKPIFPKTCEALAILILKIISCITLIFPLAVTIVYACAKLCKRKIKPISIEQPFNIDPTYNPIKTPLSETIALPVWLHSRLNNVSQLTFPHLPIPESEIKKNTLSPLTVYTIGTFLGICLKLKVEHILLDSKYDRSHEDKNIPKYIVLPSTKTPFYLSAFVCKESYHTVKWSLSFESLCLRHRNGVFLTDWIVGNQNYCFFTDQKFVQEDAALFEEISQQDQLKENHRFSLIWILLRLTSGKSVDIRERRTDQQVQSFDDPALGYWRLSLITDCAQSGV